MPAPALDIDNTSTPKLINILLERVRQCKCKNTLLIKPLYKLFIHVYLFHKPILNIHIP